MSKNSLFFVALALIFVISSCSKPSPIGSDQLEDDLLDVTVVDTLTLVAQTIDEDSILIFSPGNEISTALFGNYEDPFFGQINASVYTQIRFNNDARGPDIDSAAVLDSVVLALAYDSLLVYGDVDQAQQVEIFRLNETMNPGQSYFSTTTFGVDPTPLGSKFNFIPRPYDNVDLIVPSADSFVTETVHPHLRVRLNDSFGEYLISLRDSAGIYSDQDSFKTSVKGLHIRQTGSPTNSVLAFDLLNVTNNNAITGLWLYYHEDTIAQRYRFRIDNDDARVVNYQQDDEMSTAERFAKDPSMGDSLLFIQGMVGKNIRIDFPTVGQLSPIVVNKAELSFSVADLPGDNENLGPSSRIFAYFINENGEFQVIDDILLDRNIQTSVSAFNGRLREETVDGETVQTYRLNLSSFFQKIADGDLDRTIYLRLALSPIFTKEVIPTRSIVYGPGHSKYPMKLKLLYTKI